MVSNFCKNLTYADLVDLTLLLFSYYKKIKSVKGIKISFFLSFFLIKSLLSLSVDMFIQTNRDIP